MPARGGLFELGGAPKGPVARSHVIFPKSSHGVERKRAIGREFPAEFSPSRVKEELFPCGLLTILINASMIRASMRVAIALNLRDS